MYYVYILRSKKDRDRFYIGYTTDLDRRLREHNESRSLYTKRHAPWCVETYISFSSKELAKDFERYLKSGSGKTFVKRRLMAALR
ncbi:MAG: GIY-YIG nuclease family protein [Candidatus Omnitrophica bacterium]|nr:GIY-YIG nuclease family protein [Candidatus Omnitrophota bacterium]